MPTGSKLSGAARGIGALMPDSARNWIATLLAGAFGLFVILLLFLGTKDIISFVINRFRKTG